IYELIDGQQRLTTIYLIYRYMYNASSGFLDEPKFNLRYETRIKSEDFLKEVDMTQKEENVDFWFICNAYETILEWFESKEKKSTLTNLNKYFDENVKIIWYEVGESEDAIALFARLNIGKIPLTSAELVKAMFLSRDNNFDMDREKQEEISLQWDNIEKELHNESLWCFLTNQNAEKYQTRIDLVLNLISQMPQGNKEKYYTFFYFDERGREENLNDIWREILHTFLILKDWFENHVLYHKIGYLIAARCPGISLQSIYTLSKDRTKSVFVDELDGLIKQSIAINSNYAELDYNTPGDYVKISRLLLLFNIESVRQIDEEAQRFPFDKFKEKGAWSLEHIHAQQSEGMKKQEEWKEWLRLHRHSIETLSDSNAAVTKIIEKIDICMSKRKLDRKEFESVQQEIIRLLSVGGNTEYLHTISNLALLNMSDNAALNNSTFDVKRNKIIEMDKKGRYIPFCTKMIFLKYYTPSEQNQFHFWGQADRVAYITAVNSVLSEYLSEPIRIEKDGE
ncbi:MAG: DUF262 domain-containing protein, partial [Lachnospiraceae bacterium]|nr:DUF262 domain-containing protein [Lachnospiraceae bacterium]